MFLPLSRGLASSVLCVIAIAVLCSAAPAQDRTADWLEENGLDDLLGLYLEKERAEAAGNAELRKRLSVRLASVYAKQLEYERNPERRSTIVTAAERLLATGEAEEADQLRLALMRARYVTASEILENERAALEGDDDPEEARTEIGILAKALGVLQKDLTRRITRTDQLLDRATGLRARTYQKSIASMRQLALAASLLEGWTLYYDGRTSATREALRAAEAAFGRVLQGDEPIPGPTEISYDQQQYEFFASGVLGMALVAASIDDYGTADAWFKRLESPRTWPGIRDALPGWRIAAAIDADDPEAAQRVLESLAGDESVPAAWLRIAAVGGLRDTNSGSLAWRKLATAALTSLAQHGELAQVVDLAEKYGVDAMGADGFAFRYVRGVRLYRDGVNARNGEQSTRESRTIFERAAKELLLAVEEPDASIFEGAVAASLTLAGWSLIETEAFMDAARVFTEAAEYGGTGRADAEWGAIVALDHLVAEGGAIGERARSERDELIENFIDRFPSDDRLPSLVVRRIAGRETPSVNDIETLLAVPREHASWELARRRAAQAIYRRFRAGKPGTRGSDGHAFLDVANELLERDTAKDAMFANINGLDGLLLRQVIEIATHPEVAALEHAAKWIAVIALAEDRGAFDGHPGMRNELAYRRFANALAAGDLVRAESLLAVMPPEPDAEDAQRWKRIGAWRLHRAAADQLRESDAVTADIAKAVVSSGEYLLSSQHDTLEEALGDERLLIVAASVATARHALFLAGGDSEQGMRSLALYEAVLQKRSQDGSILQAAAELARDLENFDASLAYWRRISNGANRGSERWWAGRTNIIEILAFTDPLHAAQVVAQHKQLYPEFGPDPWGMRIREVSQRLDVEQEVDG